MAYATLLSLTQSLEQILHPEAQSPILPETEQQIMRSLGEKASFLLSFLENDSLKYDESGLEPRIRDAAYKAEAMIESSFLYQNRPRTKIHCFWEILSLLLHVIPWFHHCESCFDFQHDNVKKIVKELDSIKEEVVKMKERNQVKDLPQAKSLPSASTESDSTYHNGIVGLREELMMEIKDRLTRSPSRREIISIVGMPGIGKTTLTKTFYDDPVIVKHFDVLAWITVSHDYDVQQMLTGILDSIEKNNNKSYPRDLATHLHKTLRGRRYLIVMDDVWETEAWDQVKRFFPDDNNGSRVILTTRLQDVAVYVECPDSIYHPSLLSINDSWKLLCQKAFGIEHCPPKFEDVGKDIANSCKGLPLSLVVIGGILNKASKTLDYWRFVAQNINSALNDTHDQESHLSQFEDKIEHLVGLRYISFRCSGGYYEHPSSISKLLNLQTLVITSRGKVMLPLEIWMMPQLRPIKTTECLLPCPLDAENGGKFVPLRNLQTLKGVTDFRFSEDAIRMLPSLKKLAINCNLDRSDIDLSSYCIGNLVILHQLEALNVSINGEFEYPLPENFPLPLTLRKLTLGGFRLSPKHMAVIGSLEHLEELNLNEVNFDGSWWEPTDGEFLQLKSLSISESDVEYFIADETSFPMLQRLHFLKCTKLKEIPSRIGDIPTLQSIELFAGTGSAKDSLRLIEREQRDLGNDRLRIVLKDATDEKLRAAVFVPRAALSFIKALTGGIMELLESNIL